MGRSAHIATTYGT